MVIRLVRVLVLAVSVAALSAVGFASPSGAGGPAFLTIEKVVVGSPPEGATFVVEIEQDQNCGLDADTVTFDADGTPMGNNMLAESGGGPCTPVETETAGAATVSYSCTATAQDACSTSGPSPTPISVDVTGGNEATITVTNTFAEPPPPPAPKAVEAAPAFTG